MRETALICWTLTTFKQMWYHWLLWNIPCSSQY